MACRAWSAWSAVSSSTAELTLILRAQNLAKAAIGDLKGAVKGVGDQAKVVGSQLSTAFAGKGRILASELGSLTTNLLSGSSWASAGIALGATLAGGLVAAFGEKIIEKLAATTFVQGIMATLSAAGTAMGTAVGTFMAAAVPLAMAALPFLLVAALVAAIAFLITHPDVARKIADVALTIVHGIIAGLVGLGGAIISTIVGGLAGLGGALIGVFGAAFRGVLSVVRTIVGAVIGTIQGIVDITSNALHLIGLLNDAPKSPGKKFDPSYLPGDVEKKASGGWIGLSGPQLFLGGERGPEYVRPAGTGTGDGGQGVRIVGISEADMLDMIERGLYFRLQAAAPTLGRS